MVWSSASYWQDWLKRDNVTASLKRLAIAQFISILVLTSFYLSMSSSPSSLRKDNQQSSPHPHPNQPLSALYDRLFPFNPPVSAPHATTKYTPGKNCPVGTIPSAQDVYGSEFYPQTMLNIDPAYFEKPPKSDGANAKVAWKDALLDSEVFDLTGSGKTKGGSNDSMMEVTRGSHQKTLRVNIPEPKDGFPEELLHPETLYNGIFADNVTLKYAAEFIRPPEPDDHSVTIVFSVQKGDPQNLHVQLDQARQQRGEVAVKEIWVMCFGSDKTETYRNIVKKFVSKHSHTVVHFTTSSVAEFGGYGRLLLSYMAESRYVLLVDEAVSLAEYEVAAYIKAHKKRPGLYGRLGSIRASNHTESLFVSGAHIKEPRVNQQPTHYAENDKKPIKVDYLRKLCFFDTRTTEAFFREFPASWKPGTEDIHMSYAAAKFLGINSYVINIHLPSTISDAETTQKEYPFTENTLTPLEFIDTPEADPMHHQVRHELFRVLAGCGHVLTNLKPNITTLVYVDSARSAAAVLKRLTTCLELLEPPRDTTALGRSCEEMLGSLGSAALVFRGRRTSLHPMEVDVLEAIANRICEITKCAYFIDERDTLALLGPRGRETLEDVRPVRPVTNFNLRLGWGLPDAMYPWHVEEGDLTLALTGVFTNVQPKQVWVVVTMGAVQKGDWRRDRELEVVLKAAEMAEFASEPDVTIFQVYQST